MTLAAKERTSEFKSHRDRDQLSTTLENEEHRDRTQAISSIASWKEGFVDQSHLSRKRKTHEIAHNAKETFTQQFFNFMRKHPQYIVHMPIHLFQKSIWSLVPLSNSSL
jgi:flagellar motor switch protein FliM